MFGELLVATASLYAVVLCSKHGGGKKPEKILKPKTPVVPEAVPTPKKTKTPSSRRVIEQKKKCEVNVKESVRGSPRKRSKRSEKSERRKELEMDDANLAPTQSMMAPSRIVSVPRADVETSLRSSRPLSKDWWPDKNEIPSKLEP
ncbi:unnamed protein product [Caenorhabditis auriculariae]|uniref:Secreted protein n=1 Tax=Caenorhabditis auriculariae TaxID=2777116 RepID=A0A8S1GVT7_9PELO|nr:unnamed protein product [Caenorhabditis auriculariae]